MHRNFSELPVILNVKDLVDVMGVSRVTAYELANSRGFPSIRVGESKKRILIPKDAFLKWLDSQQGQ